MLTGIYVRKITEMFEELSVAEVLELEFEQQAFEAVDLEQVQCSKIVPNSQMVVVPVFVVEELVVVGRAELVEQEAVAKVELVVESMEQLTASEQPVEIVADSTETEHLN